MSSQIKSANVESTVSGAVLINPSQAVAKESSNQLQHTLKDLKDNYAAIESQIVNETKL